ncbi:DUF7373 family lipoprotein [Nocardia xishanensis]
MGALVTVGALALISAGCGSEVAGAAGRVEPDISKLDVGNYQTAPRQIGNAKNNPQARAREAQRLADYVALPYEADPSYIEDTWLVRPHIVLNRKTLGQLVVNDTFDEVAEDLVAGWVNSWSTGGAPEDKRRVMNIAVLEFPSPEIALQVGPALEHDDFTYNPDNVPVPITKHPNTAAHWRPTVSSIGSWTVHDRYVIFLKVVDDTSEPNLPALVSQVERMLDVQIPLLGQFEPTPADQVSRIPLDPQGIMGRTLPSNPESPMRPEPDGFYTGRGAVTLLSQPTPETLGELQKAEVDLVSFGDAVVFRSKSGKAAEGLWQEWRRHPKLKPNEKLVGTPTGFDGNIECWADTVESLGTQIVVMHFCMFQVDKYVVQAAGKHLQDLHQKISAQYALLTRK